VYHARRQQLGSILRSEARRLVRAPVEGAGHCGAEEAHRRDREDRARARVLHPGYLVGAKRGALGQGEELRGAAESLLEPEAPGPVVERSRSRPLFFPNARARAGPPAGILLAGGGILQPAPPGFPPAAPAPGPGPLPQPPAPVIRLDTVPFAELDGWAQSDPRGALQAFLRSCAGLAAKSDDAPLGGVNYAGVAVEWRQVCGAAALVARDGGGGGGRP